MNIACVHILSLIHISDTLTTELAELLIDRVLVYPDKRIEIAYKIQDIFD